MPFWGDFPLFLLLTKTEEASCNLWVTDKAECCSLKCFDLHQRAPPGPRRDRLRERLQSECIWNPSRQALYVLVNKLSLLGQRGNKRQKPKNGNNLYQPNSRILAQGDKYRQVLKEINTRMFVSVLFRMGKATNKMKPNSHLIIGSS